ncbi:glycosyltransferase [Desulfosarcina sp.]|uniref:glycosyltransferase n=1 Tax=Desulfosarcina sp. TaxID=2027861 RepID=UPI003970F987
MKICMFTNTYLPHVGGVARSVSFFSQDLRDAGHRVLVVAPTFAGCEKHDRDEAEVFRVPAIQKFNGSDFSVRIPSPFLVDEKIDLFEPDVIHSHHPYLLGDAALRAARRRQLPLIFTHHTLYEEYTHYIARNPENMKRFAAFLSTNYADMCDRVVAPSQSIRHLVRKRGVTVPVTVIPTGVDTSFFSKGSGESFREKHGIPQDSFVIGHLGRLAPEKNLDYLATAAAQTIEKKSDVYFLVVGEGLSRQTILQTFAESGLQKRLILAGTATGQTLANAYHAMNIFAFASHSETQGMVLTEAMAAGVPVIALDASGVREVVEDGLNGRLLDSQSSERQFAEMLTWSIAHPHKIAQWAKAARSSVQSFARERSVKKLQDLYADAVETRKKKGTYKTNELHIWDKFLLACRAEWDLVVGKTESIIQTVDEESKVIGLDESD